MEIYSLKLTHPATNDGSHVFPDKHHSLDDGLGLLSWVQRGRRTTAVSLLALRDFVQAELLELLQSLH